MAPVKRKRSPVKKNKSISQKATNSSTNSSSTSSSSDDSRTAKSKKRGNVTVIINNKEVTFSMKLLAAIKRLQVSTKDLIPKASFCRLVREVSQDLGEYCWNVNAINALQVSAEMYLTQLFEDANKCASHAKRVTVKPPDMDLVLDLRSSYEPQMRRGT